MTQTIKIGAGVVIVLAAMAYIITTGLSKTMVPFLSIAQVKETVPEGTVKMAGFVVEDSIEHAEDGLSVEFELGDGEDTIPVRYRGVTNDVFGAGIEVFVQGEYEAGEHFEAFELLTKCPSKYESRVDEPAGKTAEAGPA